MMQKSPRTRFAPSPTGYLHQGHLLHTLCLWGLGKALGARIILRIEDHDRQRCKPEYSEALINDIRWTGLIPDEGLDPEGRLQKDAFQSFHQNRYESVIQSLVNKEQVYSCHCSRADIRKRAEKSGMPLSRYDGLCRQKNLPLEKGTLRVLLNHEELIEARDLETGVFAGNPGDLTGDFALRDRSGNYTYQFCVVVDDLHQGVDLIIRGTDLKESTPAQLAFRRMLAPDQKDPLYWHHPVIMAADGSGKLSKTNGASPVSELRQKGFLPEDILGKLACDIGLQPQMQPVTAQNIKQLFLGDFGQRLTGAFMNFR